jgi:hypothetical protein
VRERHRALDVGEQDGDLLALTLDAGSRWEEVRRRVNENLAFAHGHALDVDQLGNDRFEVIGATPQLATEGPNREPPLLLERFPGAL